MPVRHAIIVRPPAMIGPDDALIAGLAALLGRFPVFPMFGRGRTRLQPAHVEDVGEAVARIFEADKPAPLYEFGGPQIMSYRALLQAIGRRLGRKPLLLPVPFALWRLVGTAAEMLDDPPLTRNQVALMQRDNVASPECPGFEALGIVPQGLDAVLRQIERRS